MHVLDLDLDFFLNNVAYFKIDDGERLDSKAYQPWTRSQVHSFLKKRCRLSLSTPVEGRIVEHHDGAFDFWQQLVETGRLPTPFHVTHVDSHNDLGLGDSGYCYLMSDFLHIEAEMRLQRLQRSRVEFGNYLAFAIACRWIASISWIRHPGQPNSLLQYHFKDFNPSSGVIQLKSVERNAFDNLSTPLCPRSLPILSLEPEVVFKMVLWDSFSATEPFDYVVLSKSPGFTTRESDELIPIIADYMETDMSYISCLQVTAFDPFRLIRSLCTSRQNDIR